MVNSKYNHLTVGNFGLDCDYCGKEIKQLPCKMVCVKSGLLDDVRDWAYFHNSCYKKQLKKERRFY